MKAFQYVMIFFCLSVISFSSHAELVTVKFTATVDTVYDDTNYLGNSINPGDEITGTYTIDLSVPDSDPAPEYGMYISSPPQPQGVGFTLNLPNVEYTPNYSIAEFNVFTSDSPYSDNYTVMSCCSLGSLPEGWNLDSMNIDFYDPNASTLTNADINVVPEILNSFPEKHLHIHAVNPSYQWFTINATVTNVAYSDPIALCEPPPLPAGANTLSYTATITSINPSHASNFIGIYVGDSLSGKFMINPNAPDLDSNIDIAWFDYEPGDPAGNVEVTLGGITMTGDPGMHSYNMFIGNKAPGYGPDDVNISVSGNSLSLANDAWFDRVDLSFHDPSGTALNVASIPESLPTSVEPWGERDIILTGSIIDGSPVTIIARVDTIEHNLVLPDTPEQITITPGSGFVVRGQVFETGIVIAENLPPIGDYTVTLSVNGIVNDVTGLCRPPVLLSSNHQYFECGPTINHLLEPGKNTLKVDIVFINQTHLTQEVVWELLENP